MTARSRRPVRLLSASLGAALVYACLSTGGVFGVLVAEADVKPIDNAAPALHLSLDQAIEIARSKSTPVLKAENNQADAGAQLLQGYAQFLPTLDTSLSHAYNSGTVLYATIGLNSVTAHGLSTAFTISSTLNLFNGLYDLASLRAALQRKDAAELSLDFAKQQIALDVTQTFLQVILDQQLIQISQHNLQASDARLRLLRGQTEVGQTSPADLQRQQAQRAADDQALTTAQIREHDDRLTLTRKLRLDPAQDYILDPPPLAVAPQGPASRSESDLTARALDQRPDLKAATLLWDASQSDISRARSAYFPRLDLNFARNAGATYLFDQALNGQDVTPTTQNSITSQLGNQVDYSVTLLLSWNLFDRLIHRTSVRHAQLVADNTHLDAEDAHIRTVTDVRQAKSDFGSAARQLDSAQVGVKAAQDAYNTIQGRYQVGAANFIDLLAAQSALVTAQASQAQAAINLKYQERLLLYVTGDLR